MDIILFSICVLTVSLVLRRVLLLLLLPFALTVVRRVCQWLIDQNTAFDSSWLLHVVIAIGFVERFCKESLHQCSLFKINSPKSNVAVLIDKNKPELAEVSEDSEQNHNVGNLQLKTNNSIEKQTNLIIKYVVRDFVECWYGGISSDQMGVQNFKKIIHSLQRNTYEKLISLDKALTLKLFIDQLQLHLMQFQDAVKLYKIQPNIRYKKDRSKEFKHFKTVTDMLENKKMFHKATSDKQAEQNYLNSWMLAFLCEITEPSLFDCTPAIELVSMILSSSVLLPFIDLLSQPYFLHVILIKLTSDEPVVGYHNPVVERCSEYAHVNGTTDDNVTSEEPQTINTSENDVICTSANNMELDLENNNKLTTSDEFQLESDKPVFDLGSSESDYLFSVELDNELPLFDIEEAEEACILDLESSTSTPSLYCPSTTFISIEIDGTQNVNELGGGGVYTLYNIQYEYWEKLPEKYVVQRKSVKRRYREFVALQEAFQENVKTKKYMKDIHAPSRWFTVRFGKTDAANVEKRKQNLNVFLKQVIQVVTLNNSPLLAEFLSLNNKATMPFVRKHSDMFIFDKMVMKTVKKVSTMIDYLGPNTDEALPVHSTSKIPKNESDHDIWPIDFDALQVKVRAEQYTENDITHRMTSLVCEFDEQYLTSDEDLHSIHSEFHDILTSDVFKDKQKKVRKNTAFSDISLANSLLDLALQAAETTDAWVQHTNAVAACKVLLGKFIQAFVENELKDATTEAKCLHYLELFTETIWPNGDLDTSTFEPSEEQKVALREQAHRCLTNFFPVVIPFLVGHSTFNHAVNELMSVLDHPKLNKHFAYCLLDSLLDLLSPGLVSDSVSNKLIQRCDIHNTITTED